MRKEIKFRLYIDNLQHLGSSLAYKHILDFPVFKTEKRTVTQNIQRNLKIKH